MGALCLGWCKIWCEMGEAYTDIPVALDMWRHRNLSFVEYFKSLRGNLISCEWEWSDPAPFFLQAVLIPLFVYTKGILRTLREFMEIIVAVCLGTLLLVLISWKWCLPWDRSAMLIMLATVAGLATGMALMRVGVTLATDLPPAHDHPGLYLRWCTYVAVLSRSRSCCAERTRPSKLAGRRQRITSASSRLVSRSDRKKMEQ